jgi:hypothetical protein
MPLFLQLNLSQLPKEVKHHYGTGLLQLFYCADRDCAGFEAFSVSQRVELVRPSPRPRPPKVPKDVPAFKPKMIVGWKRFDDYPREDGPPRLKYEDDHETGMIRISCAELGLECAKVPFEQSDYLFDADGHDKLGGWPCWLHYETSGPDYPNCPRCKQRMEYLYQFTGDHLPFMLGDAGIGYITRCPRHKDVVAFNWECH